jgi:hypothetical protein
VWLRGWLAAILDFPRLKSHVGSVVAAQVVSGELRQQVCCIPPDDRPYHHLIETAWVIAYEAFGRDLSEREEVRYVLEFKSMPLDEALALLRPRMLEGDARSAVDEAYARYQTTLQ